MMARALADLVVFTHFAFIVFVLFGGLLALRWRWVPWVHLPAVVWGAAIEILGGICPLTPIENSLRRTSGELEYTGGFIEHYLIPLIYPGELTHEHHLMMGGLVLGLNLLFYLVVWRRRHSQAHLLDRGVERVEPNVLASTDVGRTDGGKDE